MVSSLLWPGLSRFMKCFSPVLINIIIVKIIIIIIIIIVIVELITIILIIIDERAKRARHSQVCSIENRGYIYITEKPFTSNSLGPGSVLYALHLAEDNSTVLG